MVDPAARAFLETIEYRLADGEQVEVEVSLTLLAGQRVDVGEEELRAARRRAVQLLATGGDPRRELDPEGRAVSALAMDLETPARKEALAAGLASLRKVVEGLPEVSARLERLQEDIERAWRWYACTLLGEELVTE
jgi:ADP-ribose pyrophosphatase YjhB (NUDIX family)